MKTYRLFVIQILFLTSYYSCNAQNSDSRIEVVPVTIQQEATSIWRTINDISFFEKQGYTINLPKDEVIETLIAKSKNGTFGNDDFPIIYNLLESRIFNSEDYIEATKKVKAQNSLINSFIKKIDSEKNVWDWEFNTFDRYKVIFTLYGTGGSYDPDQGTITLLTTKDGRFMNYKNPANTIIHEITHMGMEYSIVQRYKLSHGNKERIVDTFVFLMFKDQLPDYRIQNMGDPKIDTYLDSKQKINTLNAIVAKL